MVRAPLSKPCDIRAMKLAGPKSSSCSQVVKPASRTIAAIAIASALSASVPVREMK